MKPGCMVQLNMDENIILFPLLKPGKMGVVVGYDTQTQHALVLSSNGVEWIWKGFIKHVFQ
jgi:archaellum component FlaG (FlaF/FlaG flagellin family)